ncbi:hypothetical protein GYA27_04015 [candidate division WWE3 bacterium]|uniref:Uncharacterized protein n=1 Tax=candidate division WWE3 bacterium TaxID=2053526 RepID=A0A7X9DL15_UNCKA|nr:hypothetical protein [candidate division WWE3 bacterium]
MRKSKSGTLVPVWVWLSLVVVAALIVAVYPPLFGQQPNLPNGIFAPREAETAIPLPSSTVAPALTATSTVVPTVTPSATPTQTPTSTVTFTPTATPYVFTDTIEDAWYIADLIGEPVVTSSKCQRPPYSNPAYTLSNGECFMNFGEHEDSEVLSGPYYLGLFHEMNSRLEVVSVRFYVFSHDTSYEHAINFGEFHRYIWGAQAVRAKNSNWVGVVFAWDITPEAIQKLAELGRVFDGDFWYVVK